MIVFPGKKKKPSAIKELGRGFVEGLMSNPEAAGTIAKIAGAEELGTAIEEKSRAIADKYRMPDELQGSVVDDPSLLAKPAWWTHGIGQMAGSMVGPAGVGGGAFKIGSGILKKVISDPKTVAKAAKYIGVWAGGAAGGTMEGASTYNQVLEETGDKAKALRSGTLMAVGSAVLNSASFGSMLSPKTKSKLLHMVTAGIIEGATEQAEEPWEAIVMNKPEEAAQRWLDGFNVFLPAMVTGGTGGLGGSVLTSDEKAEIRDALKKTSDLKKRTDIPGLVLESDEDSLDADEHSFLKSWLDEEDYVDFIERRKYEAQHDPAAMAAIEEEELLHQQARQPGAGAMLKDRLATEEANDFLRQEQENFDTLRRGLSQAERALGDIFGQVKSEDDADYVRWWENLDLTPVSDIIENKQEILTKRPDISPASLNDLIIKKQAEKLSRPIPEAPNPMQSEATRLGLEYVGVQEGGKVPLHLFTDPQNGSTFSVPEGESVDAALRGNRERFAPKTPVGETGDTTVQPKAEEATGGGKEQAAGVLEGEKEPWEMTRDEYDAHRISIINPEMGFEVTDTEIQSVGKAGGVQGQMQTKNKKIVRRKNADSGVTTHEIRHLIDEKHGIHNAVVQFINAAKGRSQQLREWLYSRGYIHAGRSGHFDTKELTEAVINEYLSDPAGMEKIVPELKSLLDLTDLTNYKDFNISHRQQIKKALSEGKPVPPEVLKDYPDLQQKAEPTPEVTPKATPEAGLEKSPEAKESSPSGNKIKPGWAWIKEKQRPFTTYREILRGKNKGMYRVSVGGKGYLVDKGKIARFPEGALDKEISKANIAVDEQRAITRQSLKKDHPDWSSQRVEDELAKTVRAGEEAGVSEAETGTGKRVKPKQKTLFRKSDPTNTGIPIPTIKTALEPITAKWKGAPKIVVTSTKDTKIPKDLLRQMGDAEGVAGAFYEDTVYLFHDNIDSIEDAQKTILHESAHWGPRRMFGRSFDRFLRGVLRSADKGVLDRVAKLYDCDMTKVSDRMLAAEEYVAHISETGKDAKTWNRFTSYVKQWLIKRGFTVKLSDDEIRAIVSRGRTSGVGTAFTKDGRMRAAAYHGSPHTFDKFSMEKIGTGEGAQAYGYGLYFAGKKEVAEYYKNNLAKGDVLDKNGEPVSLLQFREKAEEYGVGRNVSTIAYGRLQSMDSIEQSLSEVKSVLDQLLQGEELGPTTSFASTIRDLKEEIKLTEGLISEGYQTTGAKGHLYEVELAPEEDEYLLWDKPLSEQSEKVKKAISDDKKLDEWFNSQKRRDAGVKLSQRAPWEDTDSVTGGDFYRTLSDMIGRDNHERSNGAIRNEPDDKAASEYLHSLGIRGIKYLDGTSRGKGEGAYNYVIFSDEDVSIKARFRKKSLFDKKDSATKDAVTSKKGPGEKTTEATPLPEGGISVEPIEYARRGDTAWHKIPVEIVESPDASFSVKLEKGGHIRVVTDRYQDTGSFRDKIKNAILDNFNKLTRLKMGLSDNEYWRFTNDPKEVLKVKSGKISPSRNYSNNVQEKGLSVSYGVGYGGSTDFKYGYRVKGKVVGAGSDGEPVLDIATLEVIGGIQSKKDVISAEKQAHDEVLKDIGWSRLQEYAAITNPEPIKSSDFYKHPQVKINPNQSRPSEKGGSAKFRKKEDLSWADSFIKENIEKEADEAYEKATSSVISKLTKQSFRDSIYTSKPAILARAAARYIAVRPAKVLKREAPKAGTEAVRIQQAVETNARKLKGKWESILDRASENLTREDKAWIRDKMFDAYQGGGKMPNPRIQAFADAWREISNSVINLARSLDVKEKVVVGDWAVYKNGDRPIRTFTDKEALKEWMDERTDQAELDVVYRPNAKEITRPISAIENYFPHILTYDAREALILQRGDLYDAIVEASHINGFDMKPLLNEVAIETKAKRNANLEHARQANIPTAVEVNGKQVNILESNPFELIHRHIEETSNRLSIIKQFGQEGAEKQFQEIYDKIRKESNSDTAEQWKWMWQEMNGTTRDMILHHMPRALAHFGSGAQAYASAAMLSLASISNVISGPVPMAIRFGLGNTTKAWARIAANSIGRRFGVKMPETEALLEQFKEMGGWSKSTLRMTADTEMIHEQAARYAETAMKWLGMDAANRHLNKVANLAAYYAMTDAIESLRNGTDNGGLKALWGMDAKGLKEMLKTEGGWDSADLDRILKDGVTEDDMARFIQRSSTMTNVFMESAETKPQALGNGFWRRVFAYTSYFRMLGNTAMDTLSYAKKGNYRPLVILLLGAPAMALIDDSVRDFLKGTINQDEDFGERLVEAVMGSGALGIPGTWYKSFKWWYRDGDAPFGMPVLEWYGKLGNGFCKSAQKAFSDDYDYDDAAFEAYRTAVKGSGILRVADKLMGGPYTEYLEDKYSGEGQPSRSRASRQAR